MSRIRRSFWRAREHLQGAGESHQDVDEALPRSLHPELHQDFAGHTEPPKGAGESRSSWAQATEKFCFHPSELCCGSGAVRRPSPPHVEERNASASSRTSQLDALLSHVWKELQECDKNEPLLPGEEEETPLPEGSLSRRADTDRIPERLNETQSRARVADPGVVLRFCFSSRLCSGADFWEPDPEPRGARLRPSAVVPLMQSRNVNDDEGRQETNAA